MLRIKLSIVFEQGTILVGHNFTYTLIKWQNMVVICMCNNTFCVTTFYKAKEEEIYMSFVPTSQLAQFAKLFKVSNNKSC
jgi:hypothetical protein